MGCFKSKHKSPKEEENKIKQIFIGQSELLKEENKIYKEIDQLFHEHDKDNDLALDKEEFNLAIKELLKRNYNNFELRGRIELFIEQMVIPKRKKFTKEEFRIIMSSVAFEEFTLNEMIDLFKTFDKKKDGRICAQELMHIFKNLGLNINKEVANSLIKEASYSNYDHLDFEEFARAILTK